MHCGPVSFSFVPAAVTFSHVQIFSTLLELNVFPIKWNMSITTTKKFLVSQIHGGYRIAGGWPVGLAD